MPPVGTPCAAAATSVFPDSALRTREGWYAPQLRALGEGRLCTLPAGVTEAYRFLWLRTFHHPVAITVERRAEGARLRAREADGAGGYEPGRLVVDTSLALSADEWREIGRLVGDTQLWAREAPAAQDESGLDGARWIVEGVADARYRAVDRWTPDARGAGAAVRRLGVYMLARAGRLPRDTSEIY